MSWTTPPTFVSGAVLDAADLNILSDDLSYLFDVIGGTVYMGVSVVRPSAQSIATATLTPVSWTAATIDVGGWWSSGTDIIVPSAAIPSGFTTIALRIDAIVRFAANGVGERQVYIEQNGTLVAAQTATAINGDTTTVSVWAIVSAVAADVIDIRVAQNSGVSLAISNSQSAVTRLGGNT